MVIVHGTRKLLDRLKEPLAVEPQQSTTALGAWYATVLFWKPTVLFWKPNVALFELDDALQRPDH